MDRLDNYRQIIENILLEYAAIPYSLEKEVKTLPIFDRERDRYLLIDAGWDRNGIRVSDLMVHLALTDGKIWIHYDGTEDGIATDLERAGVPKQHIVLAFHPPEVRPFTEYAAA